MVDTMRKHIANLASWAGQPIPLVCVSALTLAGCYVAERSFLHMPFISAIFFLLAAMVFIVTRRSAISIYLASGVMLSTTAASVLKYRMKGFDLHIYDFFFTGADLEAIRFLWSAYGQFLVPFAGIVITGSLLLVVLFRYEPPSSSSLRMRLFMLGLTVAALPLTYPLDRSLSLIHI